MLLNQKFIFSLQIIAYSSLIYAIFNFTLSQWFIILCLYFIITCLGIIICYHRLLTHRSFKTHPIIENILTLVGCFALQGSPISWGSAHLTHHKYADLKKDPHSPHFGFLKAWFGSPLAKIDILQIRKLNRNTYQKFIHKYYFLLVSITYLLIFYYFGIEYNLMLCSASGLSWIAVSMVNTITHMYGSRKYNINNKSTNNKLIAFLTFGEGYHNNHHHAPQNYKFSNNDISGIIIEKYLK